MAGRAGVARVRSACTGLLLALAVAVALPAPAHAAACDRAEFEAVVQEAASVLTSLNQKNKPAMQDKLRQLRDKRGWTQAQFVTEAAPFVRDDQIDTYDKRSEELLNKISAMGQDGVTSAVADCKLLGELKGAMQGLVQAQQQKWTYLLGKLDAALGQ